MIKGVTHIHTDFHPPNSDGIVGIVGLHGSIHGFANADGLAWLSFF